MYLERLELLGFKSFAQKTILKFVPGITAIVGPNGSGKSNIADAIRWALGEQSLKVLRGKKSEDVIFAGSKKKARLGLAQVSLYLNNEDSRMPLDYANVVITRRLVRGEESDYFINQTKTRLLDIQELLAKAGFGQKTYSVIGQGMIDTLLYTSPKEKLEMFEEAAGIKSYKIKRHQTFLKLKNAQQNLTRIKDILNELNPRLRSLKWYVARAQKKEELQEKLKEFQLKFFNHQYSILQTKLQELNSQCFVFLKEKEKLQKAIQKQREEIISKENQIRQYDTQNVLRSQIEKLYNQRNKYKEDLVITCGRIQIEKERKALSGLKFGIDFLPLLKEIRSMIEEIYRAQKIFEKKLTLCQNLTELKSLKKEVSNLTQLIQNLINKIDRNLEGKDPLRSHLDLVYKKKNLEQKIQDLDEDINHFTKKLAEENARQEKARSAFFELEKKLRELQEKLENLNDQLKEKEIEKAQFLVQQENLVSQIKDELKPEDLDRLLFEFRKNPLKLSAQKEIEIKDQISKLKRKLIQIGEIDPNIYKEYQEVEKRYSFLTHQYEDLKKASLTLKKIISSLDQKVKDQFEKAFANINEKFQQYFKIIFGGGKARLVKSEFQTQNSKFNTVEPATSQELEGQNLDDTEEQHPNILIDIKVSPPGKKIKSQAMLSGGERALTAIALLFAIIACNPSPFVVLDEVDATLDEANSSRFAKILESLSSKTQFIVITHNRETMRKAKILYGVTMGEDGVSKLLSIKFKKD